MITIGLHRPTRRTSSWICPLLLRVGVVALLVRPIVTARSVGGSAERRPANVFTNFLRDTDSVCRDARRNDGAGRLAGWSSQPLRETDLVEVGGHSRGLLIDSVGAFTGSAQKPGFGITKSSGGSDEAFENRCRTARQHGHVRATSRRQSRQVRGVRVELPAFEGRGFGRPAPMTASSRARPSRSRRAIRTMP